MVLTCSGKAAPFDDEAIVRAYLTPQPKARMGALLAADTDSLAAPNMELRVIWVDAFRMQAVR